MPPGSLPAFIGRYRIEALLGKGGMGEVYKAYDPGLDRTVALKTIAPDADNPLFLERLYREAKACGRLHHPYIVTVYDLGEIEGVVFIAMEYLAGENLAAAMNRGELSFQQKLQFLIQILEALQYAHTEGVLHRDVKPSNVHVMASKTIKLLDFGLARVTRAESLTLSGAVMGTPFYMSPEQIMGQKVDGRTDIYATGVVAYELLTRRRPFDGENITPVMLKVLSEPPPPMATAWSNAFPEIERIVARALAKEADDRYATAEDMRNALSNFLTSSRVAIVDAQAEMTISAQRAVHEAKTLLADGKAAESEKLLASTLLANPDAREARQLLQQVTRVVPTAVPEAPQQVAKTVLAPPQPGVVPTVQAAAPLPESIVRADPVSAAIPAREAQPTIQPASPSAVAQAAGTPPPRSRARWVGPVAAVIGVGIIAVVMTERGTAPPGSAGTERVAAQQTSAQQTSDQQRSSTVAAPPAATASAPAATSAVPPGQAASPLARTAPTATQPTPAVRQPAPAGGGGQGGATRDMRTVFLDAGNTDTPLGPELTNAIRARNLTVGPLAVAHFEISARVQMSVRPSPVGGNSALTADYVATLQIHNLVTGARDTQMLDGHALEFGEPVVRQAALRRAAEQIAEAVDAAVEKLVEPR